MKIALTTLELSKRGGISRYVMELAERFAISHKVHLLTSQRGNYQIPNALVHRNSIPWKPISLNVAYAAYVNTRTGNRLKREAKVELLHGQGAEYWGPDVVTAHSCQKAAFEQFKTERGLGYRLMKPLEPRNNVVLAIERHNFAAGNIKKAIAVSGNVKADLMKYYSVPSDDIAVIHNGVNLEEFSPEKKADARPKVRAKLGLDEGAILAIFSGWEFKRKGLMQLVMAMPNIDGLHVMAVGGDEPEPYVRQAKLLGVGDRLHFTGPVSDMSNYYAASDLLIFPTAYEPFGLVITEAMASGIPVVTSRLAGAAEIITDGMDGMLLDNPKSPEEIAMKTNHMLDRGILGKMGAAARRTALRYSWDHVAKMTLAIYEQAMD